MTLFEYDALGLVTAATGPQGATERREFDECGMLAA
ncbi:MAG: RHS repeat protein [Olsenella uli]|nr:RHS repeat protein [Olsenella uli]